MNTILLEKAKARGAKWRQEAIDKYMQNPNICKACGATILVREKEDVAYVRSKVVCNHKCATNLRWQDKENQLTEHNRNFGKFASKGAQSRNKNAGDKARERYKNINPICKHCGKKIKLEDKSYWMCISDAANRQFCTSKCAQRYSWSTNREERLAKMETYENTKLTFGGLKLKTKNWRVAIVQHSAKVFKRKVSDPKCIVCGYKNNIEVAHKKAVSSFPETALISEINNIENLMGLCPNHHTEYDKGQLEILPVSC